jgi:DNA polymerase III delta prime subunit
MAKKDLWTFKYEPTTIESMILNPEIRPKLEKSLTEFPNLFLYGPPGIGKGTFAHVFLKQTDLDYIWVNGSENTGVDFIRNTVRPFSTAMGLTSPKICVINEADALSGFSNISGAQKMLRQLMEDVQRITRFIFLANYEQYFIPELKSRCRVVLFSNPPASDIGKFCAYILKKEKIKYDPKILAQIIKKCYPDIRKTIEALQENSIKGELRTANIYSSESVFENVLKAMLKKDVNGTRKLLRDNWILYPQLFDYLYDNSNQFPSQGGAILKIGDHLGQTMNDEINFMHMFMEMIRDNVV